MAYEWAIGRFFLGREVQRMWEIAPFFAMVSVLTLPWFVSHEPPHKEKSTCDPGSSALLLKCGCGALVVRLRCMDSTAEIHR